jgi:hypothetical protein
MSKPKAEALNYDKSITKWLLFGADKQEAQKDFVEYEGYNGWYNNRAHPNLGAVGNYHIFNGLKTIF